MYMMELSLYDDTDYYNNTPLEIAIEGSCIEALKNDLNGIILDTISAHGRASGSYFIEAIFTKNGEYVDMDECDCFCNIEERIITY